MDGSWNNPWKLTAVGMALVMITALVTGLVVANWSGPERETKATAEVAPPPKPVTQAAVVAPAPPPPPLRVAAAPAAPRVPTQATVNTCNQYAAQSTRDKTIEVLKDSA